jgi:LPXTG-site transpeptidase (sortase) family protein
MPGWMMRRPVWAAAAVLVLAAGLGAGLLAARLQPSPAAVPPVAQTAVPAPAAPVAVGPSPGAWWNPLPPATASFVPAQLVIEKLRVKATIEVKGIDAHNVMEAPDRGTEAAWYRFTARPGAGSNAVFAGHRDFGQLGNAAIFWHLDQLAAGDVIEVVSPQQTEIRYRVTQTWDYTVGTMPMASVLATDRVDEVTLITCAGTYARGSGYDHRLVVRAVRTA